MKQFKLFAMGLAVLAMFSCSKDNEDIAENNKPGEKATLTINVVGQDILKPSKVARGTTNGDKTINNYIAFVFREGGALDCAAQYSASDGELHFDGATTSAKKVYVIANTGALQGGVFASVMSETGLKAVVGDLMSATNVSSQTSTNIWMSGVGEVVFGAGEAANVGEAEVTIEFVAAKIELFVKDERIDNDPLNNTIDGSISIKDDAVVLLFAGRDGKFFETVVGDKSQAVQTHFYTGDNNYANPSNVNVTESTALIYAIKTPFSKNSSAVVNHFYTFANNGSIQPTILAIKSTKTTVGTPNVIETVYYPIHFTTTDAKHTIAKGTHYKVNVTLKGSVNESNLAVTVMPADWKTETISEGLE